MIKYTQIGPNYKTIKEETILLSTGGGANTLNPPQGVVFCKIIVEPDSKISVEDLGRAIAYYHYKYNFIGLEGEETQTTMDIPVWSKDIINLYKDFANFEIIANPNINLDAKVKVIYYA